jgi:hypothetical protein
MVCVVAHDLDLSVRDKKTADSPMTFLRSDEFTFTAGQHHFTPIYEQSKYKYLVYVDGHCAACRYGFMMRLGSVILKVAPRQVADVSDCSFVRHLVPCFKSHRA